MAKTGRKHAVVLGASMAGLGAARALTNHFERVTVIERDELSDEPVARKGVPQGAHAHGLLASGYRVLDTYFPGMMDELVTAGALPCDITGDFLWYHFGRWKLRADCGLLGIVVTRPSLEAAVRRRLRKHPKVTLLTGHDVESPVFGDGRVTGATVKNRQTLASSTLDADLVVDSLGRGSPSSKWLASSGFGDVRTEEIKVDLGYATATFERRPGDLYGSVGAAIIGTPPEATRHGFVLGAERQRWVITLCGVLRDHPPTDLAEWRAFARSLATPDVDALVKDREPLTPIVSYRFASTQRRLYSRLPRFPAGFLVVGDAVCSFNPAYGQGMSVALCQAKALDECLAEGDEKLAARFWSRVDALTEAPWAITTGEDLRYPAVVGKRPPGFGVINRYMERAHHAATRDPVVLRRFFDVANLLAPPTAMLSPAIAWRVLLGGRGVSQESPAQKLGAVAAPA
jgi:2-polyprenyl-6-methoxyphenol hydroxylase-like FAD-dependent oxidoreductase